MARHRHLIAFPTLLLASAAFAPAALAQDEPPPVTEPAETEAQEGDIVYVPRQTWHLASNGGKEGLRSCRLAMNGFPYQAHMFEQN